MQDDGGVVLHVGDDDGVGSPCAQRGQQSGLDGNRPFDEVAAKLHCGFSQRFRPGVVGAVHGVAEPHDLAAGRQFALDPCLGVIGVADGVQHVQHPARRAAVQRT